MIENIHKTFSSSIDGVPHNTEVIDNISLIVNKGEFVSIFGPNGCGKTTLLNIIAGLLEMDQGKISIDDKPLHKARIGYIFQNYRDSLFPWLKNIDNLAFPLELQGVPKKKRQKIATEFMDKLGLEIPLNTYPYQLSGGQQQLLAIVRALLFNPDVLLMDEPFGSLDYTTRYYIRDRLLDLWDRTKVTILLVSHDIDEAIYLADRVTLLSKRPAKIVEILDANFQRPRNASLLERDEFFVLKAKALHIFKEALNSEV